MFIWELGGGLPKSRTKTTSNRMPYVWTHEEAEGGNKFPKQRTKAGAGSSTVTQSEGPMHLWEEELTCEIGEKCADTGEVSLLALNCPSRLQIWPVGLREECHNGRLQQLYGAQCQVRSRK